MLGFESPKSDLYNSSYGPFSGLLQLRLFNDLCPDFCHNWYMIVVYHYLNGVIYLVEIM